MKLEYCMKEKCHNILLFALVEYLTILTFWSYRSTKDSPNDEEDQHFNYLVDNFISAATDVCNSSLPDDEIDYKEHLHWKSVLCAESALKHYNNDEKNKVLCYKSGCII